MIDYPCSWRWHLPGGGWRCLLPCRRLMCGTRGNVSNFEALQTLFYVNQCYAGWPRWGPPGTGSKSRSAFASQICESHEDMTCSSPSWSDRPAEGAARKKLVYDPRPRRRTTTTTNNNTTTPASKASKARTPASLTASLPACQPAILQNQPHTQPASLSLLLHTRALLLPAH